MEKKYPISIGVLSYNAPETLLNTLSSYEKSGLLGKTDDFFCVLQKSEKQLQEIDVCNEYKIKNITMPDNGMMGSGFKAIYDNSKYDNILFLENDFCTYCDLKDVEYYLDNSLNFLDSKFDIVRGRSRTNPGDPNFAKIYLSHIPSENFVNNTHLSECIYWVDNPELIYPTKITKIKEDDQKIWYFSLSSSCNYTNNPYICKKDFFNKAIYSYLKYGSNIESIITSIWSKQNYNCVFGFGIFTHYRKDGK